MTEPAIVVRGGDRPDLERSLAVPKRLAIAAAALFVAILALAAVWDPSIRILHLVESVPYLLAALLISRGHRYGYFLGVGCGAFWLWMAGFLTTFIKQGLERLASFVQTGHVDRWDIFIAVPAAFGAAGLVLFPAYSYLRSTDKSTTDILRFFGTVAGVGSFFILIFRLIAPRYLGMFGSMLPVFLRP